MTPANVASAALCGRWKLSGAMPQRRALILLGPLKRWLLTTDDRGSTAIEFAIIASSFMVMLLAAFEFGYMLFVQSALDNAARDAARLIRTGQAQNSANPTTTFSTLLCNEISRQI